ncbi:hypothetical protein JXA05_02015 [Candidatus Peregrinibacteria bacterium]|nr:hypothetical protein [Candidatus Peregrinibacteria bacterium]
MPVKTFTDEELLGLLRNSPIDPEQKVRLERAFPYMSEADKTELLSLVEEGNKLAAETPAPDPKALAALNKKYDSEMKAIVKDATAQARRGMEEADQKKEEQETADLQKEINAM